MTDLLLTREIDALHRQDPAHPQVSATYVGGGRIDGSPGLTVCGKAPTLAMNALAAEQLYPSLTDCPTCTEATQ